MRGRIKGLPFGEENFLAYSLMLLNSRAIKHPFAPLTAFYQLPFISRVLGGGLVGRLRRLASLIFLPHLFFKQRVEVLLGLDGGFHLRIIILLLPRLEVVAGLRFHLVAGLRFRLLGPSLLYLF